MIGDWIPGARFQPGGQRNDGQFYVWDCKNRSICNPDTGDTRLPYRRLSTPEEVMDAAQALNRRAEDEQAWHADNARWVLGAHLDKMDELLTS